MNNSNADRSENASLRREFEAGLNALTEQCWLGKLYIRQWRALQRGFKQHAVLRKTDAVLFTLAPAAFAAQAITIASRLVDKGTKRRTPASVDWLLGFAKRNPAIFPHQREQKAVTDGVIEDRRKLKRLATKVENLRSLRNKHLAHLDMEHLTSSGRLNAKYPFGPDDAEELYRTIDEILNRYSRYLRDAGTCMDMVIGEGKTDWVWGFLGKSLEAVNTLQPTELQRLLDELYHITEKGLEIRRLDCPPPSTCRRRQGD